MEGRRTSPLAVGDADAAQARATTRVGAPARAGAAARLADLLDRLPVTVFELDAAGRVVLCEGAALPIPGLGSGERRGRRFADPGRPEVGRSVRAALAGTETSHLVEADGRSLEFAYAPKRDAAGVVRGVIGVAADVTERQRAEVALTESEARLRGFVEIGSDWLWETDADLRFSYVSSNIGHSGLHAAAVLGRRREELRTGDPIDDDWHAHVEALTAQRPFRDFTYAYRDGEGRRRIAQTSGRPMLGPDGEFRGYRGTGRDVTEEVEARLKLRDSERRFRSLVTNMRDIVFCHGVQGDDAHGYDQGGAELYGADAQRLAGTVDEHGRARIGVWYEAVHPEDRPAYAALERRRKEQHEPYALDYRITHPATGELRWMREVAWVVRDEADRRTHFDSYIIDITESKRLRGGVAGERGAAPPPARGGPGRDPDLRRGLVHLRQPGRRAPAGGPGCRGAPGSPPRRARGARRCRTAPGRDRAAARGRRCGAGGGPLPAARRVRAAGRRQRRRGAGRPARRPARAGRPHRAPARRGAASPGRARPAHRPAEPLAADGAAGQARRRGARTGRPVWRC